MPCRVDICSGCGEYDCPAFSPGSKCIYPLGKAKAIKEALAKFDTSGALCDVLTTLEEKLPEALKLVDRKTLTWWQHHEKKELEKLKAAALAKLTKRERRILGLK